jgi:hypothetical protein
MWIFNEAVGRIVPGVPARDLTDEEYDEYKKLGRLPVADVLVDDKTVPLYKKQTRKAGDG